MSKREMEKYKNLFVGFEALIVDYKRVASSGM
jgi:hypothetical protein